MEERMQTSPTNDATPAANANSTKNAQEASATKPIVRLRGVRRVFGEGELEVVALDALDLTIREGEFTVMAGPSGSGKSTLLNLIGVLDDPSSGSVEIDGRDVSKLSESQKSALRRDRIGFVFQSYNLIPVMTATENAEYVLMLQGMPPEERHARVGELLRTVGLGGMENRFPSQLSGGQQQRVAFTRAIAPEPALVLADEPTANVDSQTAIALVELMRKLHDDRGVTFLMATHDMRVMKRAHRLLWLRDGKIEFDGPPSQFQFEEE
jgi:putative ABC transport system ATP-binding protein